MNVKTKIAKLLAQSIPTISKELPRTAELSQEFLKKHSKKSFEVQFDVNVNPYKINKISSDINRFWKDKKVDSFDIIADTETNLKTVSFLVHADSGYINEDNVYERMVGYLKQRGIKPMEARLTVEEI